MGPEAASLTAALISSYEAGFSVRTTRSTTETSRVGTRKERPLYNQSQPLTIQKEDWDVREFTIERRNNFANSLGSTSGRRNNVVVDGTTTTPVLVGRTIDSLLSSGGSVDGAHETFDNAKLVMDDLGKRGETVGGAGSVGDLEECHH